MRKQLVNIGSHSCLFFLLLLLVQMSCTHDPTFMMDDDPDPMDTMTMDTTMMDTTMVDMPCDPDVVYFENDILPLLQSTCAFSGCHDPGTASDGIVLNSYDNIIITGEVEAFDAESSKIFEVITDDDPSELMPPTGPLDDVQIELIRMWIDQGAKNNACVEENDCDTDNIRYSGFVSQTMMTHCNGCHGTGIESGGVVTDTYAGMKSIADDGRLFGTINWSAGFQQMPQGLPQLEQCTIDKLKSWIDEGAQDN